MADRRGAEIRRMAVQKVAAELMGTGFTVGVLKPPAKTAKDGLDKMLAQFREVCDYLEADVKDAGDREEGLTSSNGSGTVDVPVGLSLDEAMDLLDRVSGLDPDDRAKVKNELVRIGVEDRGNPRDTILAMNTAQANHIYKYLKEGLK